MQKPTPIITNTLSSSQATNQTKRQRTNKRERQKKKKKCRKQRPIDAIVKLDTVYGTQLYLGLTAMLSYLFSMPSLSLSPSFTQQCVFVGLASVLWLHNDKLKLFPLSISYFIRFCFSDRCYFCNTHWVNKLHEIRITSHRPFYGEADIYTDSISILACLLSCCFDYNTISITNMVSNSSKLLNKLEAVHADVFIR